MPRTINGTFRNIPASDVTVIAAGTNNIELQTIDEITHELKQTIDNVARKRSGKMVIMSEIPPRFDKVDLNDKIIRANHFIKKEIQKQNGWHMLCHNL